MEQIINELHTNVMEGDTDSVKANVQAALDAAHLK